MESNQPVAGNECGLPLEGKDTSQVEKRRAFFKKLVRAHLKFNGLDFNDAESVEIRETWLESLVNGPSGDRFIETTTSYLIREFPAGAAKGAMQEATNLGIREFPIGFSASTFWNGCVKQLTHALEKCSKVSQWVWLMGYCKRLSENPLLQKTLMMSPNIQITRSLKGEELGWTLKPEVFGNVLKSDPVGLIPLIKLGLINGDALPMNWGEGFLECALESKGSVYKLFFDCTARVSGDHMAIIWTSAEECLLKADSNVRSVFIEGLLRFGYKNDPKNKFLTYIERSPKGIANGNARVALQARIAEEARAISEAIQLERVASGGSDTKSGARL